jgi:hypothetical protein
LPVIIHSASVNFADKIVINQSILSLFGVMRKALVIYGILIVGLSSCFKPPEYPVVPAIKFVAVTSSTVAAGALDTIIFSFTDGDGDIVPNSNYASMDSCIQGGDSNVIYKNYYNIFLFKSNDNFECSAPDVFASPDLRPSGSYKGLTGNINVYENVQSYNCAGCNGQTCSSPSGNNYDSVVYTIFLRDLAGHLSNPIKTTPITIINCP